MVSQGGEVVREEEVSNQPTQPTPRTGRTNVCRSFCLLVRARISHARRSGPTEGRDSGKPVRRVQRQFRAFPRHGANPICKQLRLELLSRTWRMYPHGCSSWSGSYSCSPPVPSTRRRRAGITSYIKVKGPDSLHFSMIIRQDIWDGFLEAQTSC
jgi:hypothetical protein